MVDVAGLGGLVRAPPDRAAETSGAGTDLSPGHLRTGLACLAGMTFASSILPYTALGFALKPITDQFHWTREQFGFAYSYLMWCGALTVWLLGVVTDKLGARPVIIGGALGGGLVTLALARVEHLWQFYLLLALLGVFGSSAASYSKIVVSLFTRNRGKAMALFTAEGVGVRALTPAVLAFLALRLGWRGMFDALGVTALLMVPVLWFWLEEPVGVGKLADRRARPRPAEAPAAGPRFRFGGAGMREVMSDGVFWLMLGGGLISAVVTAGISTQVIAAIQDKGFSGAVVMRAMSLATLPGLAGALLGGYLLDRFATPKIAAPFCLLGALGYLLLMTVTPDSGGEPLLLFTISLGMFAASAQLPMVGYFLTRFFGLKSFATISGLQAFVQAACIGLVAPLLGRVYDLSGDYDVVLETGIVAALIAAAIYLILPAYRFAADLPATPERPRPKPAAF